MVIVVNVIIAITRIANYYSCGFQLPNLYGSLASSQHFTILPTTIPRIGPTLGTLGCQQYFQSIPPSITDPYHQNSPIYSAIVYDYESDVLFPVLSGSRQTFYVLYGAQHPPVSSSWDLTATTCKLRHRHSSSKTSKGKGSPQLSRTRIPIYHSSASSIHLKRH